LGVPKPTEMTIRNFLLKELEKRGVKVNTEISYTTPIGRLMPDMLLDNGAQYVVETKLGAEARLLDAMVRLYDYSKYTQTKGAFAVLFPKELRQPWAIEILEKIANDPKLEYVATAIFKDLRPSQRFAGNLSQIADWMASQVLRPLVVEADTSFAIKVLTEAVTSITASVKILKGKEIEDIFGGKTVFENILQYEEGRYPLEEMRQAATYLLVNQIIFYHVLSRMDVTFEAIDEDKIGKPSDLLRYFRPVLERDYSSVFGFDVASRLPESATRIVKRVIMTIKALAPEKIGQDVLGKVFHELIPFNIRKAVAAFYTNNEAAEILAQLAIEKPDAKVMDLAVGSGTLLVAAYRRKRELLQKSKGTIELEDHKRFLEQDLTGVDIMPFAAHLAVMHLSLQALLHETEKVRVAVWDSTELKPDMNIPAIHSELKAAYRRPTLDMFKEGAITPKKAYVKKGAITLEGVGGEEITLEKADLVIMNPPFTRQERLPKEYKSALAIRFNEYKKYTHGQLGLYGFFVFLADRFVRINGRIALVLPSSVLRIRSTRGVREVLAKNYDIEYIITTWKKAAFSESAKFREILLIARKTDLTNEDSCCTIVNLKRMPENLEGSRELAQKLKAASKNHKQIDDKNLMVFFVTQRELKENIENWFSYIAAYDPKTIKIFDEVRQRARTKLIQLKYNAQEFDLRHVKKGDVHGFVVRYLERAKKLNDLCYVTKLTGDIIVARDRLLNQEAKIPLSSVGHGLRSSSGVKTIDVSTQADFIVLSKFKDVNKVCPTITDSTLKKWNNKVVERAANFLIARRFVLPAPGLSALAFYSDNPIVGVDMWCIKGLSKEEAKLQTLWFNSTLNLLQVYLLRTLDTWMKIHDYTLDEFLFLNTKKLSQEQRKVLLKLFKEIGTIELPSILGQLKQKHPIRQKLDKTFLKIFGYTEDKTNNILSELYPLLIDEIEKLKIFMKG